MRATVTIPDERLEELVSLAGTSNRTAAVNMAIEAFVRQRKRERLLALAGSVEILDNDEIEALDDDAVTAPPRLVGAPRERGG